MKSYLTEWKKFKNNINEGAVEDAQTTLKLVQQQNQINLKVAQEKLAAAQAEEKRRQQELADQEKARKEEEAAKSAGPENPRLSAGTSSPAGTMPSIAEAGNQSFGGLSADALEVPVSRGKDKPNTEHEDNLALEEELTEEEMEEACGQHEGIDEGGKSCNLELEYQETEEAKQCNECRDCMMCGLLTEAKYKGRKVTLNKPMRGDVKKFKVFVRDPSTGNIKKVNFGDKKMRIKKSNPKRRKSFRARHRCANPGPKTKARYWSCKKW